MFLGSKLRLVRRADNLTTADCLDNVEKGQERNVWIEMLPKLIARSPLCLQRLL
jgi:hypothetical protein